MPGLAGAGRGRDSGSWAPAGGWAPSFGLGTLLYFCGSAPALQQFISTSPSLEDLDFYKEIATYLPPWAIIMPLPHSTSGFTLYRGLSCSLFSPSPQGLCKFESYGATLGGIQPLH